LLHGNNLFLLGFKNESIGVGANFVFSMPQ